MNAHISASKKGGNRLFRTLSHLAGYASNWISWGFGMTHISKKAMVPQAWPKEGEIFIDRASHGAQVQTIADHNNIIPKDVMEIVDNTSSKMAKGEFLNTKMVKKVGLGICISDDVHAALMFPRASGEVDMATLFVSGDSEFCR